MSDPHAGKPPHSSETPLDVRERGAAIGGEPQFLDSRLFMQLLVFRHTAPARARAGVAELSESLRAAKVPSVVYEDVNDPAGFGVLTFSEEPLDFVTKVRPALAEHGAELELRPEFTMLGRSYSSGFEPDLRFWLLERPRATVLNEAWPWAIWYPLRRTGAFARLEPRDQGGILREHGTIGKTYAAADLAHDVRLACHGLDANDNEFVIGLIGKALHPLSHVVQAMRTTRQTAEFIEQMGPFFVGRAVFRNAG
ncbi:MAG TPA: chlorite dismutase family protein [Polyangiaceae bacterium]|nr:chlorite dismutase family protein [Polyangiaceae bacterium]